MHPPYLHRGHDLRDQDGLQLRHQRRHQDRRDGQRSRHRQDARHRHRNHHDRHRDRQVGRHPRQNHRDHQDHQGHRPRAHRSRRPQGGGASCRATDDSRRPDRPDAAACRNAARPDHLGRKLRQGGVLPAAAVPGTASEPAT